MGLFDPVRGMLGGGDDEPEDGADEPEPVLPPEHREPTPTNFKNMAVDVVQDWDQLDLDFSVESLARLDSFAKRQNAKLELMRDEQGDEAASEAHTAFTLHAGSYFGETLHRALDGKWVRNGERWAVEVPGDDDSSTVHIFEVAAHSFAEQPAFADVASELRPDDEDAAAEDTTETSGSSDAGADVRPEAKSFAHSWSGYDLDFSADSLVRLETLAAEEWDASRFQNATVGGDDMDSKMYTKLVKQLGAYYGEVLVRTLGGQWTHRGDELVVGVTGDAQTTEAVFDIAAAALESEPNFVTRFRRVAQAAQCSAPEIDPEQAQLDAAGTGPPDDAQPDQSAAESAAQRDADSATETTAGAPSEPGGPSQEGQPEQPADEPAVSGRTAERSTDDQSTGYEPTADRPATDEATVDRPATDEPADTSTDPLDGTPLEDDSGPDTVVDAPTEGPAGTDSQPGDDQSAAKREPDPSVLGEPTARSGDRSSAPASETPTPEPAGSEPTAPEQSPDGVPSDGTPQDETPPDESRSETGTSRPASDQPDPASPAASEPGTSEPDVDAVAAELEEKANAGPGGGHVKTIDELREDAAAFAATWPGYDLDYSPESLQRLDALVADEYETDADTDQTYLTDRAAEAGGYFAEVVHRTLGGEWATDPAPEIVVEGRVDEKRIDPVTLAVNCFEGSASFAGTYAAIQRELSLSVTDHDRS